MTSMERTSVTKRLAGDGGLRRRLSTTLVGVSLVSVLLLASVNYVFAQILIDDSVEAQLIAVRDTRVQALEIGAARLQSSVSALAANPSVADALIELTQEFGELDDDITAGDVEQLTTLYGNEVLPPFVAAGVEQDPAELVPASIAGRYIQHHYISQNPSGFGVRDRLDDPGDGSGYSAAHREHHPTLRALKDNAGFADLLLIDIDTGTVVYSSMKQIDLGTNSVAGPYGDSGLGDVVGKLTSVAVGDSVISDTYFYVPTAGEPVFFVAAAVRSGFDVVGAVVTEVPVSALTAAMTAQEDWRRLGLGNTGEAYVVGSDGTLRTDTRAWLEDPDRYLSRHLDRYDDPDATNLIEIIGSPVLVQTVDNDAVTEGLDGNEFAGTVTNYLGTETLAVSSPAQVDGVNWAVVVELDRSESDSAVNSLFHRFLLVLAILLPSIAILGVLLARTLTRPADSLVQSAARIADGDLDTEVDDLGQNELGDLGRQLEGVVRQLKAQEQTIIDEERNINDILLALLPERLVDRVRDGEHSIDDVVDTATIISITIDEQPSGIATDNELALDVTNRLNEASLLLTERYGAERIQRSSGSQLYVTGLGHDDARVADAAEFALAALQSITDVAVEFGHELTARAGMSTGDIATGVLGNSQLSFGAWGDPTGMAMTLAALALPGQLLADGAVVEQLDRSWDIDAADELAGLRDDIEAHVVRGRAGANTSSGADAR